MRLEGQRADGVLLVNVGGDLRVLLDLTRRVFSRSLNDREVEARGPWVETAHTSTDRQRAATALEHGRLVDLQTGFPFHLDKDEHGYGSYAKGEGPSGSGESKGGVEKSDAKMQSAARAIGAMERDAESRGESTHPREGFSGEYRSAGQKVLTAKLPAPDRALYEDLNVRQMGGVKEVVGREAGLHGRDTPDKVGLAWDPKGKGSVTVTVSKERNTKTEGYAKQYVVGSDGGVRPVKTPEMDPDPDSAQSKGRSAPGLGPAPKGSWTIDRNLPKPPKPSKWGKE